MSLHNSLRYNLGKFLKVRHRSATAITAFIVFAYPCEAALMAAYVILDPMARLSVCHGYSA